MSCLQFNDLYDVISLSFQSFSNLNAIEEHMLIDYLILS